jgi:hypothetical protein
MRWKIITCFLSDHGGNTGLIDYDEKPRTPKGSPAPGEFPTAALVIELVLSHKFSFFADYIT